MAIPPFPSLPTPDSLPGMPSSPAWTRGFDLNYLRELGDRYRTFEHGLVLGAFGGTREVDLAVMLEEASLFERDGGLFCRRAHKTAVPVRDFTGEIRGRKMPGDITVSHLAGRMEGLLQGIRSAGLGSPIWLESWVEHPTVQTLVHKLGARLVATRIRASSELLGSWLIGDTHGRVISELQKVDEATLVRLPVAFEPGLVEEALAEVRAFEPQWADHYSSYNQRHSWSAISLRGFAEPGSDMPPELQIEKPAEMSRKWKKEHPGWEAWPVANTPAFAALPSCRRLLVSICGAEQRVRLMRLAPGGGELTRHADIIDREAGTANGHVARIHFPLISNPEVRFRQWRLDGSQVEAIMRPGEAWYLDTRKPHRAGNLGDTERIHLVADIYGSDRIRALILGGEEATRV